MTSIVDDYASIAARGKSIGVPEEEVEGLAEFYAMIVKQLGIAVEVLKEPGCWSVDTLTSYLLRDIR